MRVITRISQHKIQFQLCRVTGLNRSVSGAIRGKIQRPEAPRRPHRSQPGGLRNQRPGPSALPTSPLARPVHKQAGSWTGYLPCGWTGRDGSRCCCSGCRRCSCSGLCHACSPVCCTKNRVGSHAGRLLARSPGEYSLGENCPAKPLRVCMLGHGPSNPESRPRPWPSPDAQLDRPSPLREVCGRSGGRYRFATGAGSDIPCSRED